MSAACNFLRSTSGTYSKTLGLCFGKEVGKASIYYKNNIFTKWWIKKIQLQIYTEYKNNKNWH